MNCDHHYYANEGPLICSRYHKSEILYLALVESVCIHDGGGVVKTSHRHHGPVHVPEEDCSVTRSLEASYL